MSNPNTNPLDELLGVKTKLEELRFPTPEVEALRKTFIRELGELMDSIQREIGGTETPVEFYIYIQAPNVIPTLQIRDTTFAELVDLNTPIIDIDSKNEPVQSLLKSMIARIHSLMEKIDSPVVRHPIHRD